MEIKGILCDLDGTLIDTHKANLKAYNYALKGFDLKFKEEDFASTLGQDSRFFLKDKFPSLNPVDVDRVREIKSSVYPRYFSETRLNIKLLSFIEDLPDIQIFGIVTTGKKSNSLKILDFHRIRNKFNFVVTGNDVKNPKPDPEPYLKGIELASMLPEQILAFEDSEIGSDSASAAGLQVIRVY